MKGTLDYSDDRNNILNKTHRSSKTTEPAKDIEKIRLRRWCLTISKDKITNRDCLNNDGYSIIKSLKEKLV